MSRNRFAESPAEFLFQTDFSRQAGRAQFFSKSIFDNQLSLAGGKCAEPVIPVEHIRPQVKAQILSEKQGEAYVRT